MDKEVLFLMFLCVISGVYAGDEKEPSLQKLSAASDASNVAELAHHPVESSSCRQLKSKPFMSAIPRGDILVDYPQFVFKCDKSNFIIVKNDVIEIYNVVTRDHYSLLKADYTITAADFNPKNNFFMYGTKSGRVTLFELQTKNYATDQVTSFVTRTFNACIPQKTAIRMPEREQRTYYALKETIRRNNHSPACKCLISSDKIYLGASFEACEHDKKTLTNQTACCFHQLDGGEWRDYPLLASAFSCNNTHHAMTFIQEDEYYFLCLACSTMLHKYPLAQMAPVRNKSSAALSMGKDETITDIATISSLTEEDKDTLALLSLQYLYFYKSDSMELFKKIKLSDPRPSRKLSIFLPHISTGGELFFIEDIFTKEEVKTIKKALVNEAIVCFSNGLLYFSYGEGKTAISELTKCTDSTLPTSFRPLHLLSYVDSEDDDDE